jgi:Prealbumin-like fold domain
MSHSLSRRPSLSRRSVLIIGSVAGLLLSLTMLAGPVLGEEVATQQAGDHASLNIRKVDEQGNRLAGAVFQVEGLEGTFTTGDNGQACITGLPASSVWLVTEIEAPPGYLIAEPASQEVKVDNDGDCNSPDAVFVNRLAPEETPAPTPTPTPSTTETQQAATPTPREDTAGGTGGPGAGVPNTAAGIESGSPLAPLMALLALVSLGALGYANLATVRRRR